MAEFISAIAAARLISSGDTVGISGFVGCGHPEAITKAIEEIYLAEGKPQHLTLVYAAGQGDGREKGMNHFGHPGLLKRVIGGHWNLAPKLGHLAVEEKIEAYNLPQGVIVHLFRAIAGHKPGVITHVGLKTFVDPRLQGGKLNALTQEDLVEVIQLGGKEWLFYKAFPVNIAIIRGTTADERGNISMEKEAMVVEALSLAQAARNSGGKVIAQVERVTKAGTIDPKLVKIPGVLVDAIVVAPAHLHEQTFAGDYNPALSGEIKLPDTSLPTLPLDERKIVARRAAYELIPHTNINLGIGSPEGVALVAAEEGLGDYLNLSVESGPTGGVPLGGLAFGAAINPEAIIDQAYQFDFYDGGGLDVAFLGMAQLDRRGNVNVSKFGPRIAGAGGFINISQNAKKLVFCGSFTTNGLEVMISDGKLVIKNEGKVAKLVEQVDQITYSGELGAANGQPVIYVTERAVFVLTREGIQLTEVAPGIDLKTQVLDLLPFPLPVAPNVKTMDERIFRPEPMGIRDRILAKEAD
ncbi:MAG: acyl CoA:acetate/3-ketoacid CoA transferase [Clostridia bacterium]|nr:acyl CoA:acetate/3-ketoacid CoA transferase [Clostridia bacterium]